MIHALVSLRTNQLCDCDKGISDARYKSLKDNEQPFIYSSGSCATHGVITEHSTTTNIVNATNASWDAMSPKE
jgi:methionine salvage enolase-phosphatase E1